MPGPYFKNLSGRIILPTLALALALHTKFDSWSKMFVQFDNSPAAYASIDSSVLLLIQRPKPSQTHPCGGNKNKRN